jgi:hypothetical protein
MTAAVVARARGAAPRTAFADKRAAGDRIARAHGFSALPAAVCES